MGKKSSPSLFDMLDPPPKPKRRAGSASHPDIPPEAFIHHARGGPIPERLGSVVAVQEELEAARVNRERLAKAVAYSLFLLADWELAALARVFVAIVDRDRITADDLEPQADR